MSNHKRKANYKSKRSCGLCKPWKRVGNSKKLERRKQELLVTMHDRLAQDRPITPAPREKIGLFEVC